MLTECPLMPRSGISAGTKLASGVPPRGSSIFKFPIPISKLTCTEIYPINIFRCVTAARLCQYRYGHGAPCKCHEKIDSNPQFIEADTNYFSVPVGMLGANKH